LIQQSAVHYTHEFPHSLFHDLDARATNRLYSLVLSVAFRLFGDYSAVRVDHVLSVFLFVSAAVPIYLMARVVLRARWPAVVVALLSIGVPWLTLTSTLYTENLSYPLFWWMMYATCSSVWNPSIGRDALALTSIALLVCTRVQFAAVFPGYVVALVTVGVLRLKGERGVFRRIGRALLQTARTSPLTACLLTVAIAGFIYERTSSHWQVEVEKLLGTYSNVVIRNGISSNMVEGLLVELIALALGVGLLPAIVSLVWYSKRMARPQLDRASTFLCASGVIMLFFLVLTVFSQGGYLGSTTEERYFFYVIPVFWMGTFAALREGDVRPGELLACSVGLAALYGTIPLVFPLTQEMAFLGPAESVVPHILGQRLSQFGLTGLTIQDALALLVVIAGALAAYLWGRRAAVRTWSIVGAAAFVQLLVTGYAFAVITGHVSGIVGRTGGSGASLGWVDTHARSGNVVWLDNLSSSAPLTSDASAAESQERTTLFWNSKVTSWTTLPVLGLPPTDFPLSALPGRSLEVNSRSGALMPQNVAATMNETVGGVGSPFLQLAGNAMARSPDGVLELTELEKPVRATWIATGLQSDGAIAAGPPVGFVAYDQGRSRTRALSISIFIAPIATPGTRTTVRLRVGSVTRSLRFNGATHVRRIEITACLTPGQRTVRGSLFAARPVLSQGRAIAGSLVSVAVVGHAGRPSRCLR
jgi:hypothetical protein